MQKILIITGGNKGIGKGIVSEYLKNGYKIYSFSRTSNNEEEFKEVVQINIDLNDYIKVEKEFKLIFSSIKSDNVEKLLLINNAGTLGEVNVIEKINYEDILSTISLNTLVPIQLTSLFLTLSSNWNCKRKIINISSGAAEKAKFGWSIYCSSKAALDLFSQSVAIEQKRSSNGAKVLLIYPGVVDTQMQEKIRGLKSSAFQDIDRFKEMKEKKLLNDIYSVGKEIYKVDHDTSIESGAIIRIVDNR